MADLFDVRSVKGKFFLTVVAVVLVIVLFIFAYLMPQRNKIKVMESELANLEIERVQAARKAEDLSALRGQIPNIWRDQETLFRLIPDAHEEAEIVEFLHYIAELEEVTVEQIALSEPETLPLLKTPDNQRSYEEKQLNEVLVSKLRRIESTIQVTGHFWYVLGFLDQFKRTNRYYEIYSVEIPEETRQKNVPGALTLILNGYFYFYTSERAAGVGPERGTAFERMLEAEGLEEYLEPERERVEETRTEDSSSALEALEEIETEGVSEPESDSGENGGENDQSAGKIEEAGSSGDDTDSGREEVGALNIGHWTDVPAIALPLLRLVGEFITLPEAVDVEVA